MPAKYLSEKLWKDKGNTELLWLILKGVGLSSMDWIRVVHDLDQC
jgi:hypothetical protein